MGDAFYRYAKCCILCFDLTDPNSFNTIGDWKKQLLSKLKPIDPESFPFVIIGNKCDIDRKVSESKVNQYLGLNGNIAYLETSAKDKINVDKAFEKVVKLAIKREPTDEEM